MALWIITVVQKFEFRKSKMSKNCYFKNHYMRYLRNRLTDFDEIWYGDVLGPSQSDQLHVATKNLKFRYHRENKKTRHLHNDLTDKWQVAQQLYTLPKTKSCPYDPLWHSLNTCTGEDWHLKLNFSNKTENINVKTCQFTTKCMNDRVIALKQQK